MKESDVIIKTPDRVFHLGMTDEEIALLIHEHYMTKDRRDPKKGIYFLIERGEEPIIHGFWVVDAFISEEDNLRVYGKMARGQLPE